MRKRRSTQLQICKGAEFRAGFVAVLLIAACDVYNQDLIDSALGDADNSRGGKGGTQTEGGTGGGPSGGGGTITGGASGTGSGGGMSGGETSGGGTSSGGTETGGSSGDGGEGDEGSGGSGSGRGGSSTGGSAGESGSAGAAGQGGMTGGSGGAGNVGGSGGGSVGGAGAGNGGAGSGGGGAGAGGSGEVCSGCARLSVPLAANTDKAHFTIGLPTATDFRTATIAFRVARYAGTGGWFKGYIQEGSPNYLYQDSVETQIASIGTSLTTITWDVATAGTTADKSIISRIGIEISGAGATSWTNPTVIYVDSITVTGTTLTTPSFPFATSSTVYTTPTSSGPNDLIWLNNYSGDTNVTGAAVSWLGP